MRGNCSLKWFHGLVLATLALVIAPLAARAQDAATPATAPAAAEGPKFAPGVVTTIPPAVDPADAISLHDAVELRANDKLKWQPSKWLQWESATPAPTNRTLYEMAEGAAFPQDIWTLEFSFKPLRMIDVDVPQANGRVQRKQIWYMVYRVRNTGAGLVAKIQPDGEYVTEAKATEKIRFQPQFILTSQDHDGSDGAVRKAYLDRVIPAAMAAIQQRERPGVRLLNSVEMAEQDLPVESGRTQRGVWGVAMWEDVDPEIDFFSVYVGGLTNAYQWVDPAGAFKTGDNPGKGRVFTRKVLQLNFWRPGDSLDPNEREIRFGSAPGEAERYSGGEGVAYQWVFR